MADPGRRVRVGIGLPNFGGGAFRTGFAEIARTVEAAGFDGLWVFDHVVLVEGAASAYPYSADGEFFLRPDGDWYECVTTLAYLAAVTEGVDLGVGVCILPLRHPILLAKQLATVDRLSGGRVQLGLGTGWLREEFEALGVDFAERGRRRDAGMALLRACWTGSPPAGDYGPFRVPPGVRCHPTPVRGSLPMLVGGNSPAVLAGMARNADGWMGAVPARGMTPDELAGLAARVRAAWDAGGRAPAEPQVALRVAVSASDICSDALRDTFAGYVAAGLSTLIVDFGWRSLAEGQARLEGVATAVAPIRGA
jgi:probable F420-dependent oxidoreductase